MKVEIPIGWPATYPEPERKATLATADYSRWRRGTCMRDQYQDGLTAARVKACVLSLRNLANLMLARGLKDRLRPFAWLSALRQRLVRKALVESMLADLAEHSASVWPMPEQD